MRPRQTIRVNVTNIKLSLVNRVGDATIGRISSSEWRAEQAGATARTN
jgi:hypothetical protein